MQIRPARPDEIDAVVAGYDWLFAPPGSTPAMWNAAAAAERLAAAIADEASAVFVAEVDGEVAGFITVYDEFDSVRFGHRAWVEDLAVDPGHRSQGLGKGLLDAAKDWARSKGASHLELDSAESRTDAHRFYEREGIAWRSVSFGFLL